jgi:hypothetical protein
MTTLARPRRRWGTTPRLMNFVQRKVRVAEALNNGECGGSYGDACIIMGAAMSGIAAELWPGERIDRVRFVELWVRFGQDVPDACHISVPRLVDHLRQEDRLTEAETLERAHLPMYGPAHETRRAVLGREIDRPDHEFAALCPTLTLNELRRFSYPAVFYGEIRSGLVHEYRLKEDRATVLGMTDQHAAVSYSMIHDQDYRRDTRPIHFDLAWLTNLALEIATRAEPSVAKAPLPDPRVWWLDEGRPKPQDRRRLHKKKRT